MKRTEKSKRNKRRRKTFIRRKQTREWDKWGRGEEIRGEKFNVSEIEIETDTNRIRMHRKRTGG